MCSCIGENIASLLAKELSFKDDPFISLPLLCLSFDPKLMSNDPLCEDTLSIDELSELRLPGADDNEERTPVNKALIAETG